MRITLVATADFVNLTQESKMNLLGIFDEITPPQIPYVHPQMYLALTLEAEQGEPGGPIVVSISLTDSNGENVMQPIVLDPVVAASSRPGSPVGLLTAVGLGGLVFRSAGTYTFTISVDGQQVGTKNIRIIEPIEGT